jgi:hypothetical protein
MKSKGVSPTSETGWKSLTESYGSFEKSEGATVNVFATSITV